MRRGELAGLMWDRVNFTRNVIEVTRTRDRFGLRDTTKSSRKRMIPLNPESRQVLQKIFKQQLNNRFCLCEPNGNPINFHHLGRRLAKATKKAGIENKIHFHALRHTFASHFMMRGGNIYDLQKILGHSKLEMTERYSHLAPEHLEKAINIISFSGNLVATRSPEELIEENNVLKLSN
jgi:site-specific recombinase XerD